MYSHLATRISHHILGGDASPQSLTSRACARYGSITVERLYDTPFTIVDADGLDGVFENENEVNDLLEVLRTFGPPADDRSEANSKERSR